MNIVPLILQSMLNIDSNKHIHPFTYQSVHPPTQNEVL